MPGQKPPFRADMVGSLLRPQALKEAREKHEKGELSDAALKDVEDREIRSVIKRQEEIGLKGITGNAGFRIRGEVSTFGDAKSFRPSLGIVTHF